MEGASRKSRCPRVPWAETEREGMNACEFCASDEERLHSLTVAITMTVRNEGTNRRWLTFQLCRACRRETLNGLGASALVSDWMAFVQRELKDAVLVRKGKA
jgi:hypothetical protein